MKNKDRLDWLIRDTKRRIKKEKDDFKKEQLEELLENYMVEYYEEVGIDIEIR